MSFKKLYSTSFRRRETNMCFEQINQVTCVSFAPSNGLNESLLAVAAGRKISLYLMTVEEFQVPEQFSPSIASDTDDYQNNIEIGSDSFVGSANTILSSIQIDRTPEQSTPGSMSNENNNTASTLSSDYSPLLPKDFFQSNYIKSDNGSLEDFRPFAYHDIVSDYEDGNSSDEEEMEQEPSHSRKALMWNIKWTTVFRENCAVKRIQWGRNPDNFVAHLIDGTVQGYKCESNW